MKKYQFVLLMLLLGIIGLLLITHDPVTKLLLNLSIGFCIGSGIVFTAFDKK